MCRLPLPRYACFALGALLAIAAFGPARALAQDVVQNEPPAASSPFVAASGGDSRPRIGLVLSGGGARGAAHIGVLKVLEQLRIPVDVIAGTSMGAVVGGLYASGLSAVELERVMVSLDWEDAFRDSPPRAAQAFRRKLEDQNFLINFPLGLRGREFRVPRGLIQGQKLNQTLRALTLPVAAIRDFDDFPTRFRAVATDLELGETVALGSGDLTNAMRASLSAPGVFTPVEIDGRLLVDGGISDNLPVGIAKSLGVDVLIVVDVGFAPQRRASLQSVAAISNQMIAIMMRQNAAAQRRLLTQGDILIDPELNDFSSFDFTRLARAIDIGERAARAAIPQLIELAQSPADYRTWLAERAALRSAPPPTIEFVQVTPGSERYAEALDQLFAQHVGKPADAAKISASVEQLYGQGNLETLDYRLVPAAGSDLYGLELTARRNSWGPNYLRFGLNLQDNFEGDTSFNAAARITLAEITKLGGEWVWDFQIGESPRLATEIYLPLGYQSRWFIMPHGEFRIRNVPVIEDNERVAEFRVRSADFGLDLGREFSNWGELRAGVRREQGTSRVRIGDQSQPVDRFDTSELFAGFRFDRLDNVNFPRKGQSLAIGWRGERESLGSDDTADFVTFDWLGARSFGRNTVVLWGSGGTRLDSQTDDVRSYFPLGGFLNLSGLQRESLSGPHFAIARALYLRQIGRGGEGILNLPVYLGASLEMGNVWQRRGDIGFGETRKQGSLFLGLDTLVGPVYVGSGFGENGESAFYLFLGRTF